MTDFHNWGPVIVVAPLLAIWATVAVCNSLFKSDTACSACGRNLDQTTTCKDHESVCCTCHGHTLWSELTDE